MIEDGCHETGNVVKLAWDRNGWATTHSGGVFNDEMIM
jgi:hypothetical protein